MAILLSPSYHVCVDIDQGEIISPLLWVIYLDPLLMVSNQDACDPFVLKSSALLNYSPLEFEQQSLPVSHLTFMDDSTLIASSMTGIEGRLSITAEFYTLNNVQANSAKYVLLSSSKPSSLITFRLIPSPLVPNKTLTLPYLALAYLYNAVLLPRLEFRLQTSLFSESTIQSMVSPMLSLIRRKAGLATTTPLALLFLKLPFSVQNAFCHFLSSHIASWQKIFTHPDFKIFALYAISYLQGYLGAESYPTTIDLSLWSQVTSWRLWKNLNIFVGFLESSGKKDEFHFVSPYLLEHTVKDGLFSPQWAINYNSATQTFSVSRKSTIRQLCNSEKCFFQVSLSETTGYPTKNAKVLQLILSTSWSYATSLAMDVFNKSLPDSPLLSIPSPSPLDSNDEDLLPSSVSTINVDGSFHPASALSPNSTVVIATDCAQLISLWTQFVVAPFSPKLLRQHNHLLWFSIHHIVSSSNLMVLGIGFHTPSLSCLCLTSGYLPMHFTTLLKEEFSAITIYKIFSPLLDEFHEQLCGDIWLCRNILFYEWEQSQGITTALKQQHFPTISSFTPSYPSDLHQTSSLVSVSQDSWISWISSSII
ncbi:unnamed protein product [Rhizophagus irregularis]|nr:unnamed protein product [Rhizophagus irregularis]